MVLEKGNVFLPEAWTFRDTCWGLCRAEQHPELRTGVHSAFPSVDSWPAVLSYGPKADPVLRVATPSHLLHLQVGSTLLRQLPAVCS